MSIKFERDENGNVVSVDESGKKAGAVITMGDMIEKEPPTKKQLIHRRRREIEQKHLEK